MEIYDKDERYTDVAISFTNAIDAAITPIFKQYIKHGAKVRELSHVAHGLVTEIELMNLCWPDQEDTQNE